MTFPIIVRIPQNVLSTCYKTLPRPPWEFRPYCLCLCVLIVVILFIFMSAVFDARRSYENVNIYFYLNIYFFVFIVFNSSRMA
jgi:uncharacterized membrane protein